MADFSAQGLFVFCQRVSADIDTQYFFFHGQFVSGRIFRNIGQFILLLENIIIAAQIKQIQLAFDIILPRLTDPIQNIFINGHILAAETAKAIHGTAFDQAFDTAFVPFAAFHTIAEIRHGSERTILFSFLYQCIHRASADIFDCRQGKTDLTVRYGELLIALIDIGGQKLDAHFFTFFHIAGNLRRIIHHAGHQRRHKFHGVVGFQPCCLIANHRVTGRVALIERIFCEICHFIEDGFRRFHRDTILHTAGHFIPVAVDEFLSFLCHHVGFFLTHGTADKVASAKAVARQVTHDLHNLLLINDTTVGVIQDRLQFFMGILHIAAGIFPFDIFGDKVHRAGTIHGDTGDHIFQTSGLQFLHELLHTAAFQLEHAFRLTLTDHIVNRRIIFGEIIHIQLDAMDTFDFLHRRLDNGQCTQTKEVHFKQAKFFQQSHGVLCIDLTVVGRQGHIFHNRLTADDNASRMGGRMTGQAFQTQGCVNQTFGILFFLICLFQVRIHFQCFFNSDAQFCRDHLGNTVNVRIRHRQSTAYVLDGRSRRHRTKGDDLGNVFFAVFSDDIINNFLSSFITEVDIDIGHGYTFGIQETLKNQVIFQGVDGRDGKTVGNHTACRRTTAGANDDAVVLCVFDKIPDDEEIIHIAHIFNGGKFVFQTFLPLWFCFRIF